jgi:hypothetical protein
MKKINLASGLMILVLLLWTRPVSDFQWYWGTDPSVNYTASYDSGTDWVWLPFALVADGEYVAGFGGPEVIYVGGASSGWRLAFNMGGYWGVYEEPTYIPDGFYLHPYGGASARCWQIFDKFSCSF